VSGGFAEVSSDGVKTTEHFENRIRERGIEREWCERAVRDPISVRQQTDGKYKFWGCIDEVGKVLRVVTYADRETFETAFWDRRYKMVKP